MKGNSCAGDLDELRTGGLWQYGVSCCPQEYGEYRRCAQDVAQDDLSAYSEEEATSLHQQP